MSNITVGWCLGKLQIDGRVATTGQDKLWNARGRAFDQGPFLLCIS